MTRDPGQRPLDAAHPRAFVEERLEHALRIAREHVGQVEVSFRGEAHDLLRLANADITASGRVERAVLTVRAVAEPTQEGFEVGVGAAGVASTTDLGDDGVRRACKAAIATAREASEWLEPARAIALPEPRPSSLRGDRNDDGLAGFVEPLGAPLDARSKTHWLSEAIAAHRTDDLALAGRFHTGITTRAVRSSRGVSVYHQAAHADVLMASLEVPAGHGPSASRRRLDGVATEDAVRALAETTRSECLALRHAPGVESNAFVGPVDVVLSARALGLLLGWLSAITWSTRAVEDGRSRFPDRFGERVASPLVTLDDDATRDGLAPRGIPVPFDAEGIARQPTRIIDRGVAVGLPTDSRWARRTGDANTGHAAPGSLFSGAGSRARHLVMAGGEHDLDAMIRGMERGLVVSNLHYVNGLVNPRETVMTGLLRDATFVVADGRVVGHLVGDLRFTDDILGALSRVDAASVERAPVASGHRTDDSFVLPAVRIRGLEIDASRG